jgi:hypothetical protein
MELSPYSDAAIRSDNQEFPNIFMEPEGLLPCS